MRFCNIDIFFLSLFKYPTNKTFKTLCCSAQCAQPSILLQTYNIKCFFGKQCVIQRKFQNYIFVLNVSLEKRTLRLFFFFVLFHTFEAFLTPYTPIPNALPPMQVIVQLQVGRFSLFTFVLLSDRVSFRNFNEQVVIALNCI